jgi:hypothetical protein
MRPSIEPQTQPIAGKTSEMIRKSGGWQIESFSKVNVGIRIAFRRNGRQFESFHPM